MKEQEPRASAQSAEHPKRHYVELQPTSSLVKVNLANRARY